MKYKTKYTVIILLILSACFGCKEENGKNVVDFTDTSIIISDSVKSGNKPIYIAIASMTSPKETIIYYKELVNYISKKLNIPVYIKQKKHIMKLIIY